MYKIKFEEVKDIMPFLLSKGIYRGRITEPENQIPLRSFPVKKQVRKNIGTKTSFK